MLRSLLLAALAGLAIAYYFFLGPGPTLADLGERDWWQPTGLLVRSAMLGGLRELARTEGNGLRLIPVALFALPPLVLGACAFPLLRSAVLRTVALTLALTSVSFAYYGYLAEDIWRFFSWRWAAVSLTLAGLVSALALAPSLLAAALRLPTAGRACALLAAFAVIYLVSTEITGTNPALQANLSPWPIITLFGLLLIGYFLGVVHLAAGVACWVWSRLSGRGRPLTAVGPPLAVVGVAPLAGLGLAQRVFGADALELGAIAGIAAAAYALVAQLRTRERGVAAAQGAMRATAGALVILAIFLANWRAEAYQTGARDVTAQRLLDALEAFKREEGVYPDRLAELVPGYLPEVPRPRVGWIPHADEVFTYSNFGDSYALEFSSVLWVQCAYSPPYAAWEDEEDDEEEALEVDPGTAAAPDVAAGDEPGSLGGSWSCESTPPRLF